MIYVLLIDLYNSLWTTLSSYQRLFLYQIVCQNGGFERQFGAKGRAVITKQPIISGVFITFRLCFSRAIMPRQISPFCLHILKR